MFFLVFSKQSSPDELIELRNLGPVGTIFFPPHVGGIDEVVSPPPRSQFSHQSRVMALMMASLSKAGNPRAPSMGRVHRAPSSGRGSGRRSLVCSAGQDYQSSHSQSRRLLVTGVVTVGISSLLSSSAFAASVEELKAAKEARLAKLRETAASTKASMTVTVDDDGNTTVGAASAKAMDRMESSMNSEYGLDPGNKTPDTHSISNASIGDGLKN